MCVGADGQRCQTVAVVGGDRRTGWLRDRTSRDTAVDERCRKQADGHRWRRITVAGAEIKTSRGNLPARHDVYCRLLILNIHYWSSIHSAHLVWWRLFDAKTRDHWLRISVDRLLSYIDVTSSSGNHYRIYRLSPESLRSLPGHRSF